MKRILKNIFSTLSLLLIPVLVTLADPPGPPGPGGNPISNGGTPVGAPIDSGVLVLLALGVIYGAMKLYQNNTKKHRTLGEKDGESISTE